MKLNEKLYNELGSLPYKEPAAGEDYVPVPSTPLEVQQVGTHSVEIYYMNDYKDVLEEFTKQGKFAVWSSADGVNYRLAVEKDYYAKLKDLYTIKVNELWLTFWDKAEKTQKNFSRKIVLPLTIFIIIVFLFFSNWNNMFTNNEMDSSLQLGLVIGIVGVYFIFMLFMRRRVMNKIALEQQESLNGIKKHFGSSKFDELLKMQRTYIDDYFDSHYKEKDSEVKKDNEKDDVKNESKTIEAKEDSVDQDFKKEDNSNEK